jgi:tetratricopeptide (TPR) repeat protein
VEYMLTDLRDKLEGVGRLDVMTAVNEQSMKYYGRQAQLQSLSTQSLNRRARLLHAMGEDDEKRGDLNLALTKFKEAHRTTAAVLAKNPDDPKAIFVHSQSEYWVAYGLFLNNEIAEAAKGAERYGFYAQKLMQLEPRNVRYQMEVGWVDNLRAVISLYGLKDPKVAEEQVLRFQSRFRIAAKSLPDNFDVLTSLSIAHSLLGEIYMAQNRVDEALQQRLREKQLLQRLNKADPNHADSLRCSIAS